jgi:8-oxo-dGTP pyrophosphatase MutT (NUDIX family)
VTIHDRRAARVLLIDDTGGALLFRGSDPAHPERRYWFTPGGGLAELETPADGAARELFEETGLRVEPAELGEPVFREVAEFSFDGRDYRQEQEFFVLRVPKWQVDTVGFDPVEQRSIDAHRWWRATEIESSDELFYPADLADLVHKFTAPAPAPAGSVSAERGVR